MKLPNMAIIWSAGIAIFSMFFGAGNVVFPLLLGQATGNQVFWALFGLSITAVGAPILGLLASVLFAGDCKQFFYRIGSVPGYLVVLLILGLLGPLGVMPRCFIVAYAAVTPYFPQIDFLLFSQIAGLITLLLIARRDFILPLLGIWLSPLLIVILIGIIIMALLKMNGLPATSFTPLTAIMEGLKVGYNTMDLLASMVFAVSIWILLKEKLHISHPDDIRQTLVPTYIYASIIGGLILGLVYMGMSFSAAAHPAALTNAAPEQVLAQLAIYLLGSKLAVVANVAVLLACLTTVMSLAVAIGDVIHLEIMDTRWGANIPYSYGWMMALMMIITVVLSNLGFAKIMGFLAPILEACYPAIVVLAICNILYKLFNFKYVKLPVYLTFALTILWQFKDF